MSEQNKRINGITFIHMLYGAVSNLRANVEEVNNLNVFPIPDGDTGDNMLATIIGGVEATTEENESLAQVSRNIANEMLLSARGNSGVIISQFFNGIAEGFKDIEEADVEQMGKAFKMGVMYAYNAVMNPTEGTILTVANDATEYACDQNAETAEAFLSRFFSGTKKSLKRTPELLPVLESAGVVDSGGAGLMYIAEGMKNSFVEGYFNKDDMLQQTQAAQTDNIDYNLFTEDSELEFGYCTEVLVRLQNAKTDIEAFEVAPVTEFLSGIGDSIAAVKAGSILKLHVHTVNPDKVLAYCRNFGEFLKIKIENMSLQHNNTVMEDDSNKDDAKKEEPVKERTPYGVVVAASGEGIQQTFLEVGANVIVDGGQSMNPSAEDFIAAFDKANADTIFVFPNNGNVIMAAQQAAQFYEGSDVRVIESKTVGHGYAALSMMDTSSGDTDAIVEELNMLMADVVTAEVSICVRDANMQGVEIHPGDYIGFVGKELLALGKDRKSAAFGSVDKLDFSAHDICILIYGKDADLAEAEELKAHIEENKGAEVYLIDGKQDIYSYILVLE